MNERTWNNDTPTAPIDAACSWGEDFDIVVIGGGTAGIGITASLLRRQSSLRIAIVEPSDRHYYQPAWTLVGGGAYDISKTVRPWPASFPPGPRIQTAASVLIDSHACSSGDAFFGTAMLCVGLRLAWRNRWAVGYARKNVVLSLPFRLARHLVCGKGFKLSRSFHSGPMPIKCAGSLISYYLSCDHGCG